VPGFATRMVEWITERPGEWAAVVGPSARRTVENLAAAGTGAGAGADAAAGAGSETASGAGSQTAGAGPRVTV
jgi:hypothetical protein